MKQKDNTPIERCSICEKEFELDPEDVDAEEERIYFCDTCGRELATRVEAGEEFEAVLFDLKLKQAPFITEEGYIDLSKYPADQLIGELEGGNTERKRNAARNLALMTAHGNPDAPDAICKALKDPRLDLDIKEDIAEKLDYAHNEKVTKALLGLLVSLEPSNKTRRLINQIFRTLGRMGDKTAVEPLIEVLQKKKNRYNYRLRAKIVSALGKIGDERATDAILEVFKTSKSRTGSIALEAAAYALYEVYTDKKAPHNVIFELEDVEDYSPVRFTLRALRGY